MTRIYFIIAALAVLLSGGLYIKFLIAENAVKDAALETAAATIQQQTIEKEKRDRIMAEAIEQREQITNELDRTRKALQALHVTPKQAECNRLDLPDGYFDRLL